MQPTRLILSLATLALCAGCGGSDPEIQLVEASEAVEQARGGVEVARETVKAREGEVQQAQARLSEAREALRKAEEVVAKSEALVDRSATDAVLFRSVQKRLLADDALRNVAISAAVRNSDVTLTGSVTNVKQRDRALELAQTTPGVGRVESQIVVPAQAPKKKAD